MTGQQKVALTLFERSSRPSLRPTALGNVKGLLVDEGKLWEFNYMLSIGESANVGPAVKDFVDDPFVPGGPRLSPGGGLIDLLQISHKFLTCAILTPSSHHPTITIPMLLALDTATHTASVALYDQSADLLLAEQTWQARRRQTEETLPVIQEMLTRLEVETHQIDALAVTTGPGSFTGVRIAISVAKGIALGLARTPAIVGLPTLAVTAAPFFAPAQAAGATICSFLQAGRGRYNWVFFPPGSELYRPGADEHGYGKIDAFHAALTAQPQPVWLAGETTAELRDSVSDLPGATLLDGVSGLRRAGMLAWLGARHLAAGHADSLDSLEPLYLREP